MTEEGRFRVLHFKDSLLEYMKCKIFMLVSSKYWLPSCVAKFPLTLLGFPLERRIWFSNEEHDL